MKSAFLNPNAQSLFGKNRQAKVGNYTVKYSFSKEDGIVYQVFLGKGKGRQLTSSTNWAEIFNFTQVDSEYKRIQATDGTLGGAWFFKGTDIMIFSNHPFIVKGYKIV